MGIDILTLAAARAGKGGGSASKYKQPDWGIEENGVLLPETALEINPDMGAAVIMTPFTNLPEDGKTYTVNYNGGAYECIATFTKSGDDYVYALGNGAAMGLDTPASDAPFLLLAVANESALAQQGIYGLFLMLDGLESCILSANGNLVHPIPDDLVAGKGVYCVDITMDGNGSFALSSTVEKIIAAAQQGKMVCASIDGAETVFLSRYSEAGVVFQHIVCWDDGRVYLHNYECLATGTNVYRNINLV
ncbi:MAG: hypothetical protein J6V52_05170 [Bacteroidaceae bacterium]|nr:hypothetical protein [Bacteroidaceae bacterium]